MYEMLGTIPDMGEATKGTDIFLKATKGNRFLEPNRS
jgi:hypothetical protein